MMPWLLGLLCPLPLAAPAAAQWSLKHLTTGRFHAVGTEEGGLAYVIGGQDDWQLTDVIEIYDPSQDTWSYETLPFPRHSIAVASAGGIVAVAGGWDNPNQVVVDRVDLYDTQTGNWSTTNLPFAASHIAGVGIGDEIIFAGGQADPNPPLSVAQVYNVTAKTWTVVDLQYRRIDIHAVRDERRAYFAGGSSAEPDGLRALNIYDSATDTWDHTLIPRPHAGAGVGVSEGRLFVAGGVPSWRFVDILEVETGTWETILLPTERTLLAGAALGPYAIFAGGTDYDFDFLGTADIFNSLTGEWTTADLSTAALSRAVISLPDQNVALFAAGCTNPGCLGPTDHVDVFRYDDNLGAKYCGPATLNSSGRSATIRAVGASVAADSFVTLVAEDMPRDQLGYFLTGSAQGFVPFAGGSQGHLCLGGALGRYTKQVQSTGKDGRFAQSIDLRALPTAPPHDVGAGETWQFQAWFRDLNPGPTSNFTDGVSILFD